MTGRLTVYYQPLHERGLSVATRNNYVVILKEFFEFLTGTGVLSNDPSSVLRCVREKKGRESDSARSYTPEQVEAPAGLPLRAQAQVQRSARHRDHRADPGKHAAGFERMEDHRFFAIQSATSFSAPRPPPS